MADDIFALATMALRVLNLIVAALLAYYMFDMAKKTRGKSMGKTYKLLTFAFLVFALFQLAQLLDVLPGFPWDALAGATEFVFMAIILFAINNIKSTITAYEFLTKRQGKTRGGVD